MTTLTDEDITESTTCILCGRLMGDEVEYGDDWCGGNGMICKNCAECEHQ